MNSNGHDDQVPESIQGDEDLTPVLGSVLTPSITHTLRPGSASSEDYSSSSSSGMETGIRRTRNRKTWRQSLQEQDDEMELLSVGDWQVKCKTLQSTVRKLQDNLLVVNTECTRLQNNQIHAQQTKTQNELECKKLQWENERLTVQLNLTNEESMRLRESCQESDINVIKMRNELLNAKTEAGKAARELDMVKRNSMDHTECIATEERLMGTVAAIKKELNHLRDDVANLNDKVHKRGRTIKELESKAREKEIAIQQLEEKIKQDVPVYAKEVDAPPSTSSNYSKCEETEKHLNNQVDSLKQEIAMMGSQMDTWSSQVQEMKKLCNDGVLPDNQSWANLGTQMKSATLSSLLYEVHEQIKEEVEYSKQLSIFCKESTLRLAKAMKKDISFTDGAENGFKMAVDLVEHACGTIGKMGEEPEENGTANLDLLRKQDKLHGCLDKWIVDASSVKNTCSERTFMTVSNSFVPDTFEDKMEYFSSIMQSLPTYVSNSFDRIEGDANRTISSLRDQVQLFNELKQHMRDFASVIGLSSSSSDLKSFFEVVEQAFKEASGKCENCSASEDLRMQVSQLTRENDEQVMRIKELESLPVPSDIFAEKHTTLVQALQEIHVLYEKKLSIIEKFSDLKVEFVANGLSETDTQAAELKEMKDNIISITTQIDDKEESTMSLVEGIVHRPPPLEPASGDHSQCQATEKSLNESVVAPKEELNSININITQLSTELLDKDQALRHLEQRLKESDAAKSKLEEKLQEAIESSSQDIEDVIADHSSREETEKSLNESIVTLNEELNKVNNNIEELSNELLSKDQAFRQQEERLKESDAAKSKLEERLQGMIASSSQDVEDVIADHSSCEETEKSLNESIVTLNEELNKVNNNIEELSNELLSKDQAFRQQEERLKESDAAKSKLEERLQGMIASSSQDVEDVIADHSSCEETEKSLNESIVTLNKELNKVNNNIEELSNELLNKDQAFRQQEERLKESDAAKSKLEERLQELIASSSQELVNITIAHSQCHVNEKNLNESLVTLKEETKSTTDSVTELTRTLQEREDVIQDLEGRLIDATSKLEESEEVIGDCVSTEEQLAAEIKKAAAEYNEEIMTIKAQHDALVKEKSQWKEDLAAKETFIVKQNHDLAHLRDELHQDAQCQLELNTTIEMLNKKLQEAEDKLSVATVETSESSPDITVEIEVLQKELKTERQQHEQILADKIEEHSANIATLVTDHQNELSLVRSEINVLNDRLEMKEETEIVKSLTEKWEAAEALNMSLKVEIDSIRGNLPLENATIVAEFEAREAAFAEQCVNLRSEVEQLTISLGEKNKDIVQYSEQVKQHAVTIVAIEERLNQVIEKNRQYREDIDKQNLEIRDYKLTLEEYGKREVEHVTIVSDASSSSSSSSNQSLTRLRKENASLKNQTEQAQKVISALRRDIAGLGARLGDVTGDIEEATKRELDEKRIKLSDADRELATHKSKVKSLFTVIDEKLAETKRLTTEVHKLKEAVIRLKKLVEERDENVKTLQDKLDKGKLEKEKMKTEFDEQGRITKELAAHGATCRGERHIEVIANQRAALTELRTQIRDLELWPRPVPTHEAALQQVMVLKKELSELRVRESLSHTVPSVVQHVSGYGGTTEAVVEKSAHLVTMDTLDMSENSYLALLRAVSTSLEIEEVAGLRRLSHIPADEQLRLFREREQSCAIVSNRITLLRERLKRKEELLTGYEQDLAKLHRLEEVSGAQEQQVNNLTHEIRQRTEESQCLRVSLERARVRVDPNRRYISAVHQDKKLPALHHHHCVPLDPVIAKAQVAKNKEATELMKKKNYEIQTLRTELGRKDHQLDKYKRTMSTNKEKTPVPPSGRPSSAKVRRPRPAAKAKRPASAKLQTSTLSAARRSPSPPRSARTPRELVDDNYMVISSTDDIKKSLGEIVDDVQIQASETFAEGVATATGGTSYRTLASELQSAEATTAGKSFIASEITSSMMSTGGRMSFMTETKTEEGDSEEF